MIVQFRFTWGLVFWGGVLLWLHLFPLLLYAEQKEMPKENQKPPESSEQEIKKPSLEEQEIEAIRNPKRMSKEQVKLALGVILGSALLGFILLFLLKALFDDPPEWARPSSRERERSDPRPSPKQKGNGEKKSNHSEEDVSW